MEADAWQFSIVPLYTYPTIRPALAVVPAVTLALAATQLLIFAVEVKYPQIPPE
jgi:hypothetical protein